MATIKKAYISIASLLNANLDQPVSAIIDQFNELASAKVGGGGSAATSFHRNEDNVVVAARCNYHGLYFKTDEVEFGAKASSASGLNSYCKDGMSKWTKQQAEFKKAREQLLTDVGAGEVQATDIASITVELEEAKNAVVPFEDASIVGYATLEELLETL